MQLLAILSAGLVLCEAQLQGHLSTEEHPRLIVHHCTMAHGCVAHEKSVVMDANWRWIHQQNASIACYDDNKWSTTLCPDVATCAKNCAVEGITAKQYKETYGVTTQGEELRLNFVSPGGNVGSRLYLLSNESTAYEGLQLKNREIAFDADVSSLPCGVNGAVYLVQMDLDGGVSRFPGNKAGAAYGTGYCDAQCPKDVKFISGEPNCLEWGPVPGVPNSGVGKYGSCCVEMDLWEANALATAYTAHSCSNSRQLRCESAVQCGEGDSRYAGVCDKDGCDIQTYRLGSTSFYGPGASYTVDSSRPFTLVTQFITADGSDTGELVEIKRHYKQDGRIIPSPSLPVGTTSFESISNDFCAAEKAAFGGNVTFAERGGMGSMGQAAESGMVLVLSLWDDALTHMRWLDSTSPPDSTQPGAKRGPCAVDSGDPSKIEPGSTAHAIYSNIRIGEIGSTDASFPPEPPMPPAPPPPPACAKAYGQCGGKNPDGSSWAGPACCPYGYECEGNPWYKGCTPGHNAQPTFKTAHSKTFG